MRWPQLFKQLGRKCISVMLTSLLLLLMMMVLVARRFNAEAFKYILAQTAAEALMKLGIRATAQNFVFNVQGISAA
jgi:hypothetical protein